MVIVNAGIWGGKDLQKVPKPVVTFYRLIGLFLLAIYRATRSFCHKSFKILELTKNQKQKQNQDTLQYYIL